MGLGIKSRSLVLGFLVAVIIGSGCAREGIVGGVGETSTVSGAPVPSFPMVPSLANEIKLINQYGEESAPVDPKSGIAPFGILYSYVDASNYVCTVSHLRSGEVLTAAHCLKSNNPADYRIIFYDKHNQRRTETIKAINFKGDLDSVDVALITMTSVTNSDWDDLASGPLNVVPIQKNSPPNIHVWAFDPLWRHPHLAARYGKNGMVFAPKTCNLSLERPKYWGGYDATGETFLLATKTPTFPTSLFYDKCEGEPVPGNSGALISLSNSLLDIVGVHHGSFAPTALQQSEYDFYNYKTISGKVVQIWAEDVPDYGFYWSGVALHEATERNFKLGRFF
jgi:hypothetical protein